MTSTESTHLPPTPRTLMERLATLIGKTVVVYLLCVQAPSIIGEPCPPPCPPPCPHPDPPPSSGGGSSWGGPPLTPGIPPGGGHVTPIPLAAGHGPERPPDPCKGTTKVQGTLACAGTDYLVICIRDGNKRQEIIIPYCAVGMVIPKVRRI